jgi:hypothetical protein
MTSHNLSVRGFVLAAAFGASALLCGLPATPAQQSNNGKSSASSGGQKQSAEVRTEKIKFKQEFGPQTTAPRGDRTAAATPSAQNGASNASGNNGTGNNGSSSSASEFKQDFGPQSVATRKDRSTTATPPSTSGQGNGQSQQSPTLFTPDGKPTRATATLANPGVKSQNGTSGTAGAGGKPGAATPNTTKSQGANPQ